MLFAGVAGAVDVREFGDRCVAGEPVEHASGADRGELLAVTDRDQLRAGALDKIGQGIEASVIDHPGLVQDDRRVPADLDYPRVCAGDERVEGDCLSGERWAVSSQALSCRPGYGYADRVVAGVLLGACGGVDHDALPSAGGADEDSKALRSGEHPQCGSLLGAQWCAEGKAMSASRKIARRPYGAGSLYTRGDVWYAHWRADGGRQVTRRIGPMRVEAHGRA